MHIQHTSITVRNLAAMKHFYMAAFGLAEHHTFCRAECNIQGVLLKDPKGVMVELLTSPTTMPNSADPTDLHQCGLKHFGIAVDELEPCVAHAKASGAKVLIDPRQGIAFKRTAFLQDPEGNVIELMELLPDDD